MSITPEEIKKVGRLSKLALSEADVTNYTQSISNILKLAAELETVDTTDVAPFSHPLEAKQRFRADVVTEHNQRDEFLKIAPEHAAGLYLVPQVIE
jgi:aspartyl-tRNA(Asn)/glutamyl-tRNA(Gln) amidotransferase subunit C